MTHKFLSPADVRARVANKGTRFATVTFQKKDGTIRTKNGLFKPLSRTDRLYLHNETAPQE